MCRYCHVDYIRPSQMREALGLVKDMIVDLYVEMLCMWTGFEPLGSERVFGWK